MFRPSYRWTGLFALIGLLLLAWRLTVPTAWASTCSYTVRPGDTVQSIAKRYGVDATTVARVVPNGARLQAGQTITIPDCDPATRPGVTSVTIADYTADTLDDVPGAPAELPAGLSDRMDAATVQIVVTTPRGGRLGTGSVVGSDGHTVLTAFHVIGNRYTGALFTPARIAVGPYMGYTLNATVVSADPTIDLAVLRVENREGFGGFAYLPMGDSDAIDLGAPVYIFSYPARREGGLARSTGTLMGMVRKTATDERENFLTDAQASPGSSGGVVVNGQGQLIGIVTTGLTLDEAVPRPGLPPITQLTGFVPIRQAKGILTLAGVGQ
ncbi:MAG: trypsin-like peptidase domain-containing protein [Anaerolineae bacterium]